MSPGPTRATLDNGLTVVFEEHGGAEVAAVQLWVRTGARDEADPESGLSHFIEHLLFKGTATRGPGVIDQTISDLGGEMNAATAQDFTYYHAVLPARHVETAIDVLADAAMHAVFEPEELERERRVVLEEIRRAEDSPSACLWRLLAATHFADHVYARPVLGPAEVIRSASRDTIVGLYRRRYQPGASTLVVTGPVPGERVLAQAAKALGAWEAHAAAAVGGGPAPGPAVTRRARRARPYHQTYLGLAWRGPTPPDGDVHALDLAAAVLGGGRSSRLYQALRERLGLVSSIGAAFYVQRDAGTMSVTARTGDGDVDAIERAVLAEVGRLSVEPVDATELARARTAVEAAHVFGRETAEGVAYAYGLAETVWSLDFELAYVQEVRRVTAERVREAARRHLDPVRFSLAALGPVAPGAPGQEPDA